MPGNLSIYYCFAIAACADGSYDARTDVHFLPRRTNVQNELSSWFGDLFKDTKILFTSNLSTNSALMVQKGLAFFILQVQGKA